MKHLTQEQRYEISAYLHSGKSKSEIASLVRVHKSTISREIVRNSYGSWHQYMPREAQKKADLRKKCRPGKVVFTQEMKALAKDLLIEFNYSPEQISGRCKLQSIPMVSHEILYQWIWKDKRQKGHLYKYLRRRGRKNKKRGSEYNSRGILKNRRTIDQRPAIVEERRRFGDFEIDSIIGKNKKSALMTINDRLTGRLWIRKLKGRDPKSMADTAIKCLTSFKGKIFTITSDNGFEFAFHKKIETKLRINFYFARPYHSWERGANENINGLVRQYFPKGTDFSEVTEKQVGIVENLINSRPRKRLGYYTPMEFINTLKKHRRELRL
jgi:transposase, IS30 family